MTNIDPGVLRDNTSVKDFEVDENNEMYSSIGGLLMSKDGRSLIACSRLKEHISIPDGVTSIGAYAFCGSSLTSASLPDGLERIGQGAFQGCESLVSVEWPESVAEIPDDAFRYCWSLTEVTLPKSLTKIGAGAFQGCRSLASVDLPVGLMEIGSGAFSGSGLISVFRSRFRKGDR